MAHDVRQRLLHDAVGGQVDGRGQRATLARDAHPGGHAGVAGGLDEALELVQPGGRLARLALVGVAQDAEDAAQLAQRLLAGVLDRAQRLGRVLGMLVEDVGGDPRLHV